MDADDIAYPWRLSRQVALFADRPELGFCGAGVDTLLHGRVKSGELDPVFKLGQLPILSKFFTIFMHPTVVYNRQVIGEDSLFYDPGYRHAEDFDLFRRLAARYPAAMMPENLLVYRVHPGSVTSRHGKEMRRTHLRIVAENLEREGLAEATHDLRDIGKDVSFDTVARAAEFIVALEERIATLPDETRPSFAAGALNLFYFLYQLVGDEKKPPLTHGRDLVQLVARLGLALLRLVEVDRQADLLFPQHLAFAGAPVGFDGLGRKLLGHDVPGERQRHIPDQRHRRMVDRDRCRCGRQCDGREGTDAGDHRLPL